MENTNEFNHIPVLLKESIDLLNIKPDGIYVDATGGGGTHSKAIYEKLKNGRLITIDRDPQAIEVLRSRLSNEVVEDNFHNIKEILKKCGINGVDGILADLGVSSHQLDSAQRGFSFHSDAPLDMRMSMEGMSAADVVNTYSEYQLRKILYEYGEEKFAASIAKNIIKYRADKPIETTLELVEIIKKSMPAKAKRDGHPARRTFQAIRIEVNGELDRLEHTINDMFDCLSIGGRLAIITFHSLEDRIVKKTFAGFCVGCECPASFPVCTCDKVARGKLPVKAVKPTSSEIEENPRSRSAIIRVVEKCVGNEKS